MHSRGRDVRPQKLAIKLGATARHFPGQRLGSSSARQLGSLQLAGDGAFVLLTKGKHVTP